MHNRLHETARVAIVIAMSTTALHARDLAYRQLTEVVEQFAELPPDAARIEQQFLDDLDGRDAALAQTIVNTSVRHWLTIEYLLQPMVRQDFEALQPQVRAALVGGAAQLLYLDRVPTHAAVDESVRWVKHAVRAGAGGLVNAVLRRVARLIDELSEQTSFDAGRRDQLVSSDGGAIQLTETVLPDEAVDRLSVQSSCPPALVQTWISQHGRAAAESLAMHAIVHPPLLVTGLTDASAAQLAAHDIDGFFVCDRSRDNLAALLQSSHEARVQDPATAAPIEATRELAPKQIIDMCAGRGTKTKQLAALHPEARIIATDISEQRLEALRKTSRQFPNIEVISYDELDRLRGWADLLVVDAPCSNTGVLPRRLEARYRANELNLASLVAVQKQLLATALPLAGDDGQILYITCSIDRFENQDIAAWLTGWHPWRIKSDQLILPAGQPGGPPNSYHDGGYHALLERT